MLTIVPLGGMAGCAEDSASEEGPAEGEGSGGEVEPACGPEVPCALGDTCTEGVCGRGPIHDLLPELPAGQVAEERAEALVAEGMADLPGGRFAVGRPGDLVLRNDRVAFVIQRPHRDGSLTPYGGNVIDAVRLGGGDAGGGDVDELGEVMPVLHIGLTVDFESVRVLNDGSDGGPAAVVAVGRDAIWDTVDLGSLLGRFDLLRFDLNADLPLLVAAVYSLEPGSGTLRASFTLLNEGEEPLETSLGLVVDPRGAVDDFVPGRGHGAVGFDEIFASLPPAPYLAFHGARISYGLLPLHFTSEGAHPPAEGSAVLNLQGITAAVLGKPDILRAVSEPNVTIPAGEAATFGYDLLADATDAADVHEWWLRSTGEESIGMVRGTLTGAAAGAPEGARVAVLDEAGRSVTAAQVVDGGFEVALAAGSYQLRPATRSQGLGESTAVTVEGGGATEDVDLQLPEPAGLAYAVRTRSLGGEERSAACRLSLIGAVPPELELRAAFDPRKDPLPPGHVAVHYSRTCDSADDGPLRVRPGRYLAVISRGPRHSAVQEIVDLEPGETTTIRATLHEVVDTGGYVAMDCHIHTIGSPDSKIEIEAKLLAYLAEDVDFLVSTDHDVLTDLGPAAASMGAEGELSTTVGVESTTFAHGHYIGFPLPIAPDIPTRGAPDWAGGRGPSLTANQLFAALRDLGAEVVQLAHPAGFSGFFARSALTFDLEAGAFGFDTAARTPNEELRLGPGEPFFSDAFDTLEIATGAGGAGPGGRFFGGASDEPGMNDVMRHWFDFLSVGMPAVGVGCSDSHGLVERAPGYARTYLPALGGGGPARPDLGALSATGAAGARHGDVIVTNGPWLSVRGPGGAAPGALVTPDEDGSLEIEVTVEVPTWLAPPDQLEVFANNTYTLPASTPAERAMEPVHEEPLEYEEVPAGDGGVVLRATTIVTLATTQDEDAWVVVRAIGGEPLFPLMPASIEIDLAAETPERFITATEGRPPFAVANPLFVDTNGDGAWVAPLLAGAPSSPF